MPINGQLLPSRITGTIGYCTYLYERGLWPRSGSRDFVYVTQNIKIAHQFAAFWTYCKCRDGNGTVYEVSPGGEIHGIDKNDLWCSSASIVSVVIPQVTMANALKAIDIRHRMVLDLMAKEFSPGN